MRDMIGDFSRFHTAEEFMAFVGLVPSEHSSGRAAPARSDHQGRQQSRPSAPGRVGLARAAPGPGLVGSGYCRHITALYDPPGVDQMVVAIVAGFELDPFNRAGQDGSGRTCRRRGPVRGRRGLGAPSLNAAVLPGFATFSVGDRRSLGAKRACRSRGYRVGLAARI